MVNWPNLLEILPEGEHGTACIDHYEISKGRSAKTAIRREQVPEGRYVRLMVGGHVMMSNTSMEKFSNQKAVNRSHGHVLIGGLGIGLIIIPICEKDDVLSVTVIEKNPDVIALVAPHIKHQKLTIIQADIMEWRPAKGRKFNSIYFDIWPDINLDNLDDIKKLHACFKFRLDRKDPHCWMSSWKVDDLRYLRESYKRDAKYGRR